MATQLRAGTAGTVWQIQVSAGERVTAGQALVILESMKMEVPQESPCGGVVTTIAAEAGAVVEEGQSLLEIDPQG